MKNKNKKYRIIIEVEYTDPPPNYLKHLSKIAQREALFTFGHTARVVSAAEIPVGDVASV